MAVQFSCPECDKVLKVASPVAPGKKVKCPSCGTVFAPAPAKPAAKKPADDETVELPRTKPASMPKPAKPEPFEDENPDDDDLPVAKSSGVQAKRPAPKAGGFPFDDETVDEQAPQRKKAAKVKRRDDDDDLDDEDERPARGGKKKSSAGLFILLGLLVVVLGLGAVGAFIWPGFLKSDGKTPKGASDVWTFIPADSVFVGGLNLPALRGSKNAARDIDALKKLIADSAGPKGKDLAALTDKIDAAIMVGLAGKEGLAIISFIEDMDPAKLKDALGAKDVAGKSYAKGDMGLVAFPSPKILLLSDMPAASFEKRLGELGKAEVMPPDLKAQVDKGKGALVWAAAPNSPTIVRGIEESLGGIAFFEPSLKGTVEALKKLKGLGLEVREEGTSLLVKARVECQDAKDATSVQDGVNKVTKLLPLLMLGLDKKDAKGEGLPPEVTKAIRSIANTLKTGAEGSEAWMSATISQADMAALDAFAMAWFAKAAGPER